MKISRDGAVSLATGSLSLGLELRKPRANRPGRASGYPGQWHDPVDWIRSH